MLLKELVHQDGANFFNASVRDIKFVRVWVAEVEIRQERNVKLTHRQVNHRVVRWALVEEVN